jgi:MFS family permease
VRWLRRLAIDISPLRASQDFRLLWSGSVVSAVGSQFARVGLYVQVYALTGSPAAVGLLGLSGLAGSLAGVFVGASFIDRHDRRRTLLWTQLAAMGVAVTLVAGAVSGHPPLWLLHLANAATWFLAAIHGPSRQASIPRVLPEATVPAAIALNQAGYQVASIVGPALAGLLIQATPPPTRSRSSPRSPCGRCRRMRLRVQLRCHEAPRRWPRVSAISGRTVCCSRRSRSISSR